MNKMQMHDTSWPNYSSAKVLAYCDAAFRGRHGFHAGWLETPSLKGRRVLACCCTLRCSSTCMSCPFAIYHEAVRRDELHCQWNVAMSFSAAGRGFARRHGLWPDHSAGKRKRDGPRVNNLIGTCRYSFMLLFRFSACRPCAAIHA